jgi:hypothetical protein
MTSPYEDGGAGPFVLPYPEGGACLDAATDPDLMLPKQDDEHMHQYEQRAMRAKQICSACIAKLVCLDRALSFEMIPLERSEMRPSLGIRGGMTDEERRALRSRARTRRKK